MKKSLLFSFILLSWFCLETRAQKDSIKYTGGKPIDLPQPYATKSARNFVKVIGWSGDHKPVAPAGFTVTKFASGLDNPRWIYVAPNGDIFIAESATQRRINSILTSKSQNLGSADRITMFRDKDKDGKYEHRYTFLEDLDQPFGMLVLNNKFYVANTNGIITFPYNAADTSITVKGKKILDLPADGYNNHWTRNIISNPEGTKIYVTVGSASNIAEHGIEAEQRRANILEINPDGTGEKIYAGGLRNPNGMDWAPVTGALWTAVNERDGLGDDLVPDYATSVREGGFYGWPYAYFGSNEDPRLKGKRPDLVKKTLVPDITLGSHTASLGLAFYKKKTFPVKYQGGMFIGQHGSWNRSQLNGYKVVFIPFKNGIPSGKAEAFLTGFIASESKSEVYGRPVCVVVMPDGSLLVTDDSANTVWQVSAKK